MISNIQVDSVAFAQHQNSDSYSTLSGNIIPHSWYGEIVSDSGNTDFNAITILSEIVYWYRPSKDGTSKFNGSVWQTSYCHFEQKFGFNKQRIRRALVKLEDLGIIKRELKTIYLYGQKYNNVLFIHLLDRSKRFSKITKNNSDDNAKIRFEDNHNSNSIESIHINELDTLEGKSNTEGCDFETDDIEPLNLEPILESSEEKTFFLPLYNFDTPSLQNCRDYIKKEENNIKDYKDRSMRSSFEEGNFSNIFLNEKAMRGGDKITSYEENNQKQKDQKPKISYKNEKRLIDFYPLSSIDCSELRRLCSREFSDNAINEILKDLARKKPEWSCNIKKGFMSYMSEILRFEKRNAILISGQGFRINNNLTKEEQDHKIQERFLSEIENSLDISPEMQLKKKLSSRLSPNSAYRFLRSYIYGNMEGENFKIYLKGSIELSELEEEIILGELRSIYDMSYGEEVVCIKCLVFEIIKEERRDIDYIELTREDIEDGRGFAKMPRGIWGDIRMKLVRYFGKAGHGLDASLFSKLDAIVDEESREVTLRAPNKFMKDWINNRYGSLIENICKAENFTLNAIVV